MPYLSLLIIIPAEDRDLYPMLMELVKDINQQFVDPNEVLSDRVYVYLKDDKKFV